MRHGVLDLLFNDIINDLTLNINVPRVPGVHILTLSYDVVTTNRLCPSVLFSVVHSEM